MAEYRRVTSDEDAAEVARLAREIWTGHYVGIIGQGQVDYMLGKFQSADAVRRQMEGGQEYYLIMDEGRAEGYFALAADGGGKSVFLSKIYVRREARGRGLGRAAVSFIEGRCREIGAGSIWLTVNKQNADTIRWYERVGFRKAGAVVKDIGSEFVMDDFRMEKTCGPLEKRSRPG